MGDNKSCPTFVRTKIAVVNALRLPDDATPICAINGALAAILSFAVMHAEPGQVEASRTDLHTRLDAYFDDAVKEIAAFYARHPEFSNPTLN